MLAGSGGLPSSINSLDIDTSNNICVVGNYEGTLTVKSYSATTVYLGGGSGTNLFLVKYNTNGNVVWATLGTTNINTYSINIDISNNIYIVGTYCGARIYLNSWDWDNGGSTISLDGINNHNYSFLAKYNDTGVIVWATNIIGDNNSALTSIISSVAYTDNNTAFGNGALENLTIGSNNIALGYNAGNNLIIGDNNIYIGNTGINGDNNKIRIGNSENTECNMYAPIVPQYSYNAITGTNIPGSIGYYITNFNENAVEIIYTPTEMLSITCPNNGVWLISASIRVIPILLATAVLKRGNFGLSTTPTTYNLTQTSITNQNLTGYTEEFNDNYYWEPNLTYVGTFESGDIIYVTASIECDTGIQAIHRYIRMCRIA